ncbi:MAG: hypothetical protein LUQ36_03975 [Methanoregula sp.]|nr:hypothetical protein [Methanoregula sp.]
MGALVAFTFNTFLIRSSGYTGKVLKKGDQTLTMEGYEPGTSLHQGNSKISVSYPFDYTVHH